jgi:hypothetical protein
MCINRKSIRWAYRILGVRKVTDNEHARSIGPCQLQPQQRLGYISVASTLNQLTFNSHMLGPTL